MSALDLNSRAICAFTHYLGEAGNNEQSSIDFLGVLGMRQETIQSSKVGKSQNQERKSPHNSRD